MNPQNPPTSSVPTGGIGTGDSSMQESSTLKNTKNAIAQTARDTASKVKSAASSTAARAKQEAERLVTDKKQATADRIGSYSSAIHDSARSLEADDPNIAWLTHQAADKLQGVADYMRNRDFAGLRDDAANLARRHPAAFFGGMFVAGLILGNIVKASQRKAEEDEMGYAGDSTDWSNRTTDDLTTQENLPMSTSPLPSTSAGI